MIVETETRTCRKCGEDKPITEFKNNGPKQGRLRTCKECRRPLERKRTHEFYLRHKERMNKKTRKHYADNRSYYATHRKQWIKDNPERARELWNRAYKKDAMSRASRNMSRRMRESLKTGKQGLPWEMLAGFSARQLKEHLESKFTEGMTWDNYGDWHIDHKIPISFFEYSSFNDVEFKMCWRLENLQPLWAIDNIKKGNKVRRAA